MTELPGLPTARPSTPDGRGFWNTTLLVTGIVLTLGGVVLVAVVAAGALPGWALSFISLGVWGPICLVVWAVLERNRRRLARLERDGIATRATVRAIRPGGGEVNGQPLLRLDLTVTVPGQPARETSVRTLAPLHLVGILRPGVTVPVLADPRDPGDAWVDWSAVERETSPTA